MTVRDAEHDDPIARLTRLAGRRPVPDPARVARPRAAARAEWLRAVRARRRWRWLRRTSGALVAAAAVAMVWFSVRAPALIRVRSEVAMLYSSSGAIRIVDPQRPGNARTAISGDTIRTGDQVDVAERSLAAFRIGGGASVRLKAGTAVVFASADRIELRRGTLYVDSNPAKRDGPVRVDTPFGLVTHVGTQFELHLQPGTMDLRVREGTVIVKSGATPITSHAGEAVRLSRGLPPERRRIAISGAEWAWVSSLARPFTLEGSTVASFLGWAAREQGWECVYDDAVTRRLAERALLCGTIEGLTPAEAIDAVLPSANLSSRLDGNRLLVRSLAARN